MECRVTNYINDQFVSRRWKTGRKADKKLWHYFAVLYLLVLELAKGGLAFMSLSDLGKRIIWTSDYYQSKMTVDQSNGHFMYMCIL